jgi:hypothetical protein
MGNVQSRKSFLQKTTALAAGLILIANGFMYVNTKQTIVGKLPG